MSDCREVTTRKRLQAIAQGVLETGALSAGIDDVVTTIPIAAYPSSWPTAGDFTIVIGTEKILITAGHGTTSLTGTRGAASTTAAAHLIAAAVSLLSTRCILSVKNFELADQFFKSINVVLQIRGFSRGNFDYERLRYEFAVRARLYFSYARNADYDYTTVENILSALLDAWAKPANYIVSGTRVANCPIDLSSEEAQEDRSLNPIVGFYEIMLRFPAGVC